MARVVLPMQITAIDQEQNLFIVSNMAPPDLVHKILATDWMSLAWQRQPGQEGWSRRRINHTEISWIEEWHAYCNGAWADIALHTGHDMAPYYDTAWWVDEPGFCCSMHTDGEMPGAMQLTWHSTSPNNGTAFYWSNNGKQLRHQFPCVPNTGYIMINKSDKTGFRKLLWHAMLEPVPAETYRLTSYSWINPL